MFFLVYLLNSSCNTSVLQRVQALSLFMELKGGLEMELQTNTFPF